jgi:hypothetical protein
MKSWIGVDLDGTMAKYDGWINDGFIGEPIPAMINRIKKWLKNGIDVYVFTARVSSRNRDSKQIAINTQIIQDWCKKNIGTVLPVTAEKDLYMIELWDDRAVRVKFNDGSVDNEYVE